ncbi:2,3-bisphosphoglycerate-independent phosphoglycerate mutase [Haloquadratum walsbyi]|jgi:phosphoglycerate mutase (EC 5.4.2.1)|uniref:2,3-bisphosphoglycerate-independent phosphoglycerate mutase n=1 Tax=Haloquadratum walsbyi J07HQW2 TaxID=1238425 RepID=U1PRM3_9EURY|nr:2,3-bisphosphoglycerate-independent phosphoglycerate mutase [Haloquadratum walsbyi]ERG94991.1 MAG: 2,3-bisphosphoglycerate-independent phosphoglycerate mutase [Haloquadratum walsbyi J07HQW2]
MQTALVILDGWGLGDHSRRNAVQEASTPTFDRLIEKGADGRLDVSGRQVGLPVGQMGNSEVGHLHIGAGQVVKQAYTRVEDAIDNGSLRTNAAVNAALNHAVATDGRIHFMGLLSDGGVHSEQEHLHALIELASDRDVDAITHVFTDGRDTNPHNGEGYLTTLEDVIDTHGTGDIATVSGRYYAMDRDKNWRRTQMSYDAIVNRTAAHSAPTAVEAVTESYNRGESDEFIEPTVINDTPAVTDGDAVFIFNFRPDRVRQLVRLLGDINPVWSFETAPPAVELATMTEYDETFPLPVAFPPNEPRDTLGEIIATAGLTQLRIAESEKYAHVTYFLNGGREVAFEDEHRKIIQSPNVSTYDQQPSMSVNEVTDTAIEQIDIIDPDLLILNYANPDMVGHTGDFTAAVEAIEAVDTQLDRLLETIYAADGHAIVTADHGNADDMGTAASPHTAHTTNPVPIIYTGPDGSGEGYTIRDEGSLCDIAPTLLEIMSVEQPAAMTGTSLIK